MEYLPAFQTDSLGAVHDFFDLTEDQGAEWPIPQGPHNAREFAQRLYAFEALHPAVSCRKIEEKPEPYSLQWFLGIEHLRHDRYARWLPSCLEFNKHAGETLLGLGIGLGTDWVQYARHGAAVVVCSPSPMRNSLR